MKIKINFLIMGVMVALLSGCQTVEYRHTALPELTPSDKMDGLYHKVSKGETLWRIAKAYVVSIDDIIRFNHIPNAALIEENQLLFILHAQEQKKVSVPIEGVENDDFAWPVRGEVMTFFDQQKGIYRSRGIDIRSNPGVAVRASRGGRVVFADYLNGYAETIKIGRAHV